MKNNHSNGFIRPTDSSLSRKGNAIALLFFGIVTVLAFLPVLLVIMSAFSSEDSVAQFGYRYIPHEFSLEAFRWLLRSGSTIPRALL